MNEEWRREMSSGIREMNAKIDNNHKWTIGLMIAMLLAMLTGFGGIIAAMILF